MSAILPISLFLALVAPAQAGAIDRHVGDDVVLVVRLDLAQIDVDGLLQSVFVGMAEPEELDEFLAPFRGWLDALGTAGAREFYLLVNPMDLPRPPVAIVPIAEEADAEAIGEVLCRPPAEWRIANWPTCATIHGAVFAGTDAALERLRAAEPASRPEIAEALAAVGEAPVQVILAPSATQRRIFEEMSPTLPRELGGGPITTLTQGMKWAAIVLEAEPRPTLRLVVEATDEPAAARLGPFLGSGLELLKQALQAMPAKDAAARGLVEGLEGVAPEVAGARVTAALSPESVSVVVGGAVQSARMAAKRSQSVNNLKQIGLAMHNHASRDNTLTFPPAAITNEDGTPLLSWRVAILPYIEQQALYDEFHLDEPWDSEHNKALIERIPPTYGNPAIPGRRAEPGTTVYLAPRGEATIFPENSEGITIRNITDGTSNTILIVEANADQAVIWTKPEDWDVGDPLDTDSLFGIYPTGTNTLFADGSVRFIRSTIDPKVLLKLFTRNGGEVIGSDEY